MEKNVVFNCHFLSILLILLLTGCGTPAERQVRQTLRCAEEVLAERPDSALTLLTPLDTMPLAGEEQAWYAVLRTQADYKLYHPLTTDSLPLLATAYYGTPRRPHYRAAMAWYSLGCVYTDQNDDPRAIDAYLKARDLFPDTLCRYYALTEQNLGKHHLANHDYSKAVATFARYRNHPNCCGDSALIGFADFFLGKARMMKNEFHEADSLFHSVLANPHADAEIQRQTLFHLAKIYHAQGDNASALFFLEAHRRTLPKDINQSAEDYLKGDILFDACTYDSAFIYYRRSLAYSTSLTVRCLVYNKLAKLAPMYEPDSLASYIDHHAALVGTINANARTTEIEQIQIDHQTDLKLQQAEYEKNRLVILLSAAALMLLLLFLFLYTRADRRRKQEQLRLMQQLRAKEVEIMELNTLLPADRSRLLALYRQEAAVCRSLALSQEGVRRLAIGRSKALTLSVQERDALLAAVRESYVTLFQKVHSDGTILSEQDRDICALSHLQISTRDIAEMLSMAEETVRTHKHRMKQKLDSDLFQLFFEKA